MREVRGVDALTRRERQVAETYVGGATYRQVGERLGIAPATVRKHLSSIYRKLGVASKVALLRHLDGRNPLQVAESAPSRAGSESPNGSSLVFLAPFDGSRVEETQFGVDLVAELRSRVARLTGLTVTSDPQSAGLVIEGNVRLAAGLARVYVRLIEAGSGVQVWADRHEIERGESFETIDRCAARISGAIRWRVAARQAALIADSCLDKLSLEQVLVLAGTRSYVPTRASWLEGGRIAEFALGRAPDNFMALAMAATGLGLAEALLGFGYTPSETFDLALKRIEMALSYNSQSYMAHTMRALLLLFARQRHSEAADSAQYALSINAEYSTAHWALGAAQVFSGLWDVGCQTAERAAEIDPQDPYLHLYVRIAGFGHLGAGRLDRAAMCFQKCDHLAPGLPQNLAGLAVVRAIMGEREAAALAVASLREAEPGLGLLDLCPLPFREPANWALFAEGLRSAGMSER